MDDQRLSLSRSLIPKLWLLLLGFFASAQLASAQTFVTLRLIDAQSGKPIKGISVGIAVPEASQSLGPDKEFVSLIVVKIDKEGKGKFLVPKPAPAYVEFTSHGALHGCSERKLSIEDALRTGEVAAYHYDPARPNWCPEPRAQASANPGEIVILDKPMTTADLLLRRQF